MTCGIWIWIGYVVRRQYWQWDSASSLDESSSRRPYQFTSVVIFWRSPAAQRTEQRCTCSPSWHSRVRLPLLTSHVIQPHTEQSDTHECFTLVAYNVYHSLFINQFLKKCIYRACCSVDVVMLLKFQTIPERWQVVGDIRPGRIYIYISVSYVNRGHVYVYTSGRCMGQWMRIYVDRSAPATSTQVEKVIF